MRRRALVVFALAAGCETGEAAAPPVAGPPARPETRDFAGGTRLRARAWDVEGALVLRDFFDVARGEPCTFVADGVFRSGPGPSYFCLPPRLALHDAGIGPYADEACTVPVALTPGPDEAASLALVRPVDACTDRPVVHRAGPLDVGRPWVRQDGACLRSEVALPLQGIGDALPLEAFARAEERVVPRAGRIHALRLVTADGAFQTIGGFDSERGMPVRVQRDRTSGAARWVPSRVLFLGAGEALHADATCAPGSALATKIARDAICPPSAVLVFADACGGARFRDLGSTAPGPRFTRGEAGCVPRPGADLLAASPGPPIDDAVWAPAAEVEVASTTVRRRGWGVPGGDAVTWTDVLSGGEPCAPARSADGATRCLPVTSAAITTFADDACTMHAYLEPLTGCEVPGDAPRLVREDRPEGARVWEVTGEAGAGAPALFRFDEGGGGCVPYTPPVPSRSFILREADLRRFAEAGVRER